MRFEMQVHWFGRQVNAEDDSEWFRYHVVSSLSKAEGMAQSHSEIFTDRLVRVMGDDSCEPVSVWVNGEMVRLCATIGVIGVRCGSIGSVGGTSALL